MIQPTLLKSVRREILENLSFTPKETDIYKIHQSGDLANLDGLDDSSLARLPSLLTLRNALYSTDFRSYLSTITGAGPLSGQKTDMAINVYSPGCHLLCHDDVIGSRRVSYILYLTDPEKPWRAGWGGALRLYSTKTYKSRDGTQTKVPNPDPVRLIEPVWNQLSFFAVRPGESFHDVEEVFPPVKNDKHQERVRMAISGWYHIPQEGEDGFEEGLEMELVATSSLTQLQSKNNEHDLPQPDPQLYPEEEISSALNDTSRSGGQTVSANTSNGKAEVVDSENNILTESEIDFLLKYLSPTYLTPDTIEGLNGAFNDSSCLRIENFLNPKYATVVRSFIESQPKDLPHNTKKVERQNIWKVACPPHKHRYLYILPTTPDPNNQNLLSVQKKDMSPIKEILSTLLPSPAFRKWLHLITDLKIMSHDILARRFRKGYDYSLATGYDEEHPKLELTLGITPSKGWEDDDDGGGGEDEEETGNEQPQNENGVDADSEEQEMIGAATSEDKEEADGRDRASASTRNPDDNVGGYEAYMSSDPLDTNETNESDPAVYQSAPEEGDEGGILFSMPAGWNRLSLVLRDQGVMRFVKYVSARAEGDRWDVVGEFDVEVDDRDEEDDGEDNGEDNGEDGKDEVADEDGDESSTDLAEAAERELNTDSESD